MNSKPNILVITATYNEAQNISAIIEQVLIQNHNADMLVIDDNSPDGTSGIVSDLIDRKEFNGRLYLISRPSKLGYGTAFIEGFSFGISNKKYDCFVSMDADFSHDPSYIKTMADKLNDCDIIIGSRYIKGGGTRNWGIHRRILSRFANLYSRLILGMKVADCTSGFRCYRRNVIESIDFKNITSTGYSFLEELIYLCKLKRFTMQEIPIIFADRKFGKSKICRKEIFKAMANVPLMRLKELLRSK